MAGLPKKYAKLGFKKGWKAYKRAGGGTRKRRGRGKISRRRNPSPAKRKASAKRVYTRKRRRTFSLIPRRTRGLAGKSINAAMGTAVGVAGAVGSAIVVKMLPLLTPQSKALAQLGLGVGILALIPRRQRLLRIAGIGSSLAGGIALTKVAMPQVGQYLLAGDTAPKKISYYRKPAVMANMGINSRYETMGINTKYQPTLSGNGYGNKFLTPADIN